MKKRCIALILSTPVLLWPNSARASNFEDICFSGDELTQSQQTLCFQWAGYLDRFHEGVYDLPQQPPSTAPVESYADALAAAQQWRSQEGYNDVMSGNFDSVAARNWRGANWHNDQTYRRLSGQGPIEMPRSPMETSSNGIDMALTGGPTGSFESGLLFTLFLIIAVVVILRLTFGASKAVTSAFTPSPKVVEQKPYRTLF